MHRKNADFAKRNAKLYTKISQRTSPNNILTRDVYCVFTVHFHIYFETHNSIFSGDFTNKEGEIKAVQCCPFKALMQHVLISLSVTLL